MLILCLVLSTLATLLTLAAAGTGAAIVWVAVLPLLGLTAFLGHCVFRGDDLAELDAATQQ